MPLAASARAALLGALLAVPAAPAAAARGPGPPRETPVMRSIAEAEDRRDGSAAGGLPAALADRDPVVRARAALAVGRLQDSLLVPRLLPLLSDRDPLVRREAAFALGQTGHRSARMPLEGVLRARDGELVMLAIEALGKLGDAHATAAILPFVAAGTREQRMRACESLWRLADTTAAGALIARLGERDAAVRWRVVYALEKLPLPARIVPAVTPLLADPDPLVRAHAARTLGRMKSRLATSALLARLDDPDAAVVVNAVRSLQLVADASAPGTGARLVALLKHRDPYVRVSAATALADSFVWAAASGADSAAIRAALKHGMGDGDAATRGACGRALLVRGRLAALDTVRPLFADSMAVTRNAVVDGLRFMRGEDLVGTPARVVNALSGAYHVDGHRLVRMTAADVGGQLLGRTHHPALASLLQAFRKGLDDPDVLLCAAAAGALADAGDSASVPRLAAAYARRGPDADADARIGIRDALRTLAGRAFADSVEQSVPAPAAPAADPAFHERPREKHAVLHTAAGDIEWEFLTDEAPQTVRNFAKLARRGYFDSLVVHRVVPDFVIQDGDPTGTGSGGPGYTIRCEYNRERYEAGMVGMALSGKDTGGSQWFITLSPQPHLNGRYTIFARVTKGLDVAKRVTQGTRVNRVEVRP